MLIRATIAHRFTCGERKMAGTMASLLQLIFKLWSLAGYKDQTDFLQKS